MESGGTGTDAAVTSLDDLPEELLALISSSLDPPSLFAFSLATKHALKSLQPLYNYYMEGYSFGKMCAELKYGALLRWAVEEGCPMSVETANILATWCNEEEWVWAAKVASKHFSSLGHVSFRMLTASVKHGRDIGFRIPSHMFYPGTVNVALGEFARISSEGGHAKLAKQLFDQVGSSNVGALRMTIIHNLARKGKMEDIPQFYSNNEAPTYEELREVFTGAATRGDFAYIDDYLTTHPSEARHLRAISYTMSDINCFRRVVNDYLPMSKGDPEFRKLALHEMLRKCNLEGLRYILDELGPVVSLTVTQLKDRLINPSFCREVVDFRNLFACIKYLTEKHQFDWKGVTFSTYLLFSRYPIATLSAEQLEWFDAQGVRFIPNALRVDSVSFEPKTKSVGFEDLKRQCRFVFAKGAWQDVSDIMSAVSTWDLDLIRFLVDEYTSKGGQLPLNIRLSQVLGFVPKANRKFHSILKVIRYFFELGMKWDSTDILSVSKIHPVQNQYFYDGLVLLKAEFDRSPPPPPPREKEADESSCVLI